MNDLTVSVAAETPDRGIEFSVPVSCVAEEAVTVKTVAKTTYAYCARAARRLRRFITVRARAFAAVLESRVRAYILNVFPKTGADILRQSAILNI